MRKPFLAIWAFCLAVSSASAADSTFTGYARSLDGRDLLYVESHAISRGGNADETRVVLYRCSAASAPFARKELDYATNRIAPAFAFEDARSGFVEGLKRDTRGLEVFERAGAKAELRTEMLSRAGALVADAGFDEFVRTRWDSLESGASAEVPFLVPSRLDSVKFKVRKVSEATIEGEAANVFRLSVAGPLGWFLSDIDVSYRKRDRRLMRYRGITNIRDAGGEMLSAQIDFPTVDRSEAAVDLPALRALPLVSRCQ
ncbi:MAG: hypothetical protein ABI821_07540 [Pseudomonadota bacterium]